MNLDSHIVRRLIGLATMVVGALFLVSGGNFWIQLLAFGLSVITFLAVVFILFTNTNKPLDIRQIKTLQKAETNNERDKALLAELITDFERHHTQKREDLTDWAATVGVVHFILVVLVIGSHLTTIIDRQLVISVSQCICGVIVALILFVLPGACICKNGLQSLLIGVVVILFQICMGFEGFNLVVGCIYGYFIVFGLYWFLFPSRIPDLDEPETSEVNGVAGDKQKREEELKRIDEERRRINEELKKIDAEWVQLIEEEARQKRERNIIDEEKKNLASNKEKIDERKTNLPKPEQVSNSESEFVPVKDESVRKTIECKCGKTISFLLCPNGRIEDHSYINVRENYINSEWVAECTNCHSRYSLRKNTMLEDLQDAKRYLTKAADSFTALTNKMSLQHPDEKKVQKNIQNIAKEWRQSARWISEMESEYYFRSNGGERWTKYTKD